MAACGVPSSTFADRMPARHCHRGFRSPAAILARKEKRGAKRKCMRRSSACQSHQDLRGRVRNLVDQAPPSPSQAENPYSSSSSSPSCSKSLLSSSIASFNARTLRCSSRQKELAALATQRNFAILAVQEHRIVHQEPIVHHDLGNGSTLVTSSADCKAVGGIGFMFNSSVDLKFVRISSHSSRIMEVSCKLSNRIVHVFSVYSPTACHPVDSSTFYSQLSSIIRLIPTRDVIIIAGDFNACLSNANFKVGKNINGNSEMLLDLVNLFNLTSLNANYRKRMGKRATFFGPNSRMERLDHILTNSPRLFYDCNTLCPYAISSDHRLVFACMKSKFRNHQPRSKKTKFAWEKLSGVKEEFSKQIDEAIAETKFVKLQDLSYKDLAGSILKVARSVIPAMPCKPAPPSWDSDASVVRARRALKNARRAASSCSALSSAEALATKERVKKCVNDLAAAHKSCVEKEINGIIHAVQQASDERKHCVAWKIINSFRKQPAPRLHVDAFDATEANVIIKDYFNNLLNPNMPSTPPVLVPPPDFTTPDDDEFCIGPIEEEELFTALQQMKPLAAPGPDDIPVAALRIPAVQRELLRIINCMLEGKEVPGEWRVSAVLPIPKNASRNLHHQRGISLMSTAAKAYHKVLHNRLSPVIDPHLRYNQNGGRKSRSTVGHILALRIIMDACKSHQSDCVVTFVDFAKAFDSVTRLAIPDLLHLFNVPVSLVNAVMLLYSSTSSFVRSHYGDTDTFPTTCGVLQGDTLAPFLFTLFIDYVLRHACPSDSGFVLDRRRSSRHPEKRLADLDFVDDIAVVSNDTNEAQRALSAIERVGRTVGLKINQTKTKFIAICSGQAQLTTSSGPVERVQSFRYLGSILPSSKDDIACRRGLAWSALGPLKRFWSSDASQALKLCLFRHTIEPVFLYGCESWALSESLLIRLDQAYDSMIRHALGYHWPNVIATADLRLLTPSARSVVRQRRMRLIGHLMRSEEYARQPIHDCLWWSPSTTFRRGYARSFPYRDLLVSDFSSVNRSDVFNRKIWKCVCDSVTKKKRNGMFA